MNLAVHFSSITQEHYTPACIIGALGALWPDGIDLDPCSNRGAPVVPARIHHDIDADGLTKDWIGNVYVNPPYGREIGRWVAKACAEFERGYAHEIVILAPSRTDTAWFRSLRAYPRCFVSGRLTFIGNKAPAPFPSCVFYLGHQIARFAGAFRPLGDIYGGAL